MDANSIPDSSDGGAFASGPLVSQDRQTRTHTSALADSERAEALKNIKTAQDVLQYIEARNIPLVDVCFSDALGQWHHCTFHADQITEDSFVHGLPFDGSSIRLCAFISMSDLFMLPDPTTCWIDPFASTATLHLTASVLSYDQTEYAMCARTIAQKCEQFAKDIGVADDVFVGFEAEFFMFESVKFICKSNRSSFEVDSFEEGSWNSASACSNRNGRNLAHRVGGRMSYFPVAPIDSHAGVRSSMLMTLKQIGLPIEKHHHEAANCQHELGLRFSNLVDSADMAMAYKYVIKNVAQKEGLTATFMPKPMEGYSGSGMHCHFSLWKKGQNLFHGEEGSYGNLSQMALWFIGGLLKHAHAVLAFTNSTTNSYKRLVKGFEAPCNLAYSLGNRSAAVRIPVVAGKNSKATRIEFRCPDSAGSPYLIFAAQTMAGLDGVLNKIDPPPPCDCNLYDVETDETGEKLTNTPTSLEQALCSLEIDSDFLTRGGVFTKDFIRAYIIEKRKEIARVVNVPTPMEYELYYHC